LASSGIERSQIHVWRPLETWICDLSMCSGAAE
jgi:hypothetical protein